MRDEKPTTGDENEKLVDKSRLSRDSTTPPSSLLPYSFSLVVNVQNLEGTMALGRHLGRLLFPGAVVGLSGPLGAGKTHFVRAVSEGLGLTQERAVSSPTFVLVQEYEGRLPIYHFD